MLKLLVVSVALSSAVVGCASSKKGEDQQVKGDLMTALMKVAGQMELSARPQQEAFEREIVPGLMKDEVRAQAAAIAAEAEKESKERKYSTSTVQVTSSGDLVCFADGAPKSTEETDDGTEVWVYECHHKTYRVAFDGDRVVAVGIVEDD